MKKIITIAALLGTTVFSATSASAQALAMTNFNANYTTTVSSCLLCHTTANGNTNKALNTFGANFKTAGGAKPLYTPVFTTLDGMNADGSATNNGAQIKANIAPAGNGTMMAFTVPAATTSTPAASSSSGGGCIASSVTTPLMMVLAILSLGFFVRRKKD